jgi:hypothetical protein
MIQKVARSLERGSPFVVWDEYRDEEYHGAAGRSAVAQGTPQTR